MSKNIRKILASIVGISMIFTLFGCGKDNSAEESLRAELESLREQAEETEEAEETEATDEEPEETEAEVEETEETEDDTELRSWNLPFTVADESYNLGIGQIAGDGEFYYTLAGVREFDRYHSSLEDTYYDYLIPDLPDGQVVIHPLIQLYNATDSVKNFDESLVTLYVDNVQVTRVDTNYTDCYWVDGLEEQPYSQLDPGETVVLVSAFNVDPDWSTLTVFYGDASWTITHDELLTEPYEYTNLFEPNQTFDITEPGTTVYDGPLYDVVFDGFEVYTSGLRTPHLVFEYTINNTSNSVLTIEFPYNTRCYYESRLQDSASSVIDEPVNGYNNINDANTYGRTSIEIHPGMSSKVFACFIMNETTGVYEMYFETEGDGVLAHVSVMVE